jgi:hypothetical protein
VSARTHRVCTDTDLSFTRRRTLAARFKGIPVRGHSLNRLPFTISYATGRLKFAGEKTQEKMPRADILLNCFLRSATEQAEIAKQVGCRNSLHTCSTQLKVIGWDFQRERRKSKKNMVGTRRLELLTSTVSR